MSALGIVAMCLGGVAAYCVGWAYTFSRLLWYYRRPRQSPTSGYYYRPDDSGLYAFWAATFLPIGLALVAIYALADGSDGLPPRAVRRQQKVAKMEAEIKRLEHELEMGR